MKMKCGHEVVDYELEKQDGIVFIRYVCEKGHWTKWKMVGEAPYPDEIEMEEENV